ncbi:translation initiation factor IF-2-like [Drosophila biarmipes]|uniref:translation initiation factor IF-2-like n=1 Tax=Drosophila biarmipes TaxID=125945 RepID=UPI0007E8AABB|nr:translation initiation factor IF-2-like [Drosophila biarmipes]
MQSPTFIGPKQKDNTTMSTRVARSDARKAGVSAEPGGAAEDGRNATARDGGGPGMAGPFATGRGGEAAVVGGTGMPTHPEVCRRTVAASPPGWLPEVPLTPRYEGSPTRPPSSKGEALPPRSPPPPQPDTPPSPARRGGESPRWKPARPPTPRFERPPAVGSHPRPDTPQYQPGGPVGHHVRKDIPAAHVTHSMRSFVAEGMRWRQQTVVWTWPEGPAEKATVEEPRIWKETGPRVSPMDPRTRGRPDTEYAAIDSRYWANDTGNDAKRGGSGGASGEGAVEMAGTDGRWKFETTTFGARGARIGGAGRPAMAGSPGAGVARRNRGGTGGTRGSQPGRQAQRADQEWRTHVSREAGARGH